jgi:hypothetical protein
MSDQIADVLDDAADYLEPRRWGQAPPGKHTPDSGYCALGVLGVVGRGRHLPKAAAIGALVRMLGLDEGWDLALWNDAPGRTKQQVLDAFRGAAKAERMPPGTSALADPPVGWGGPDPGRRAPTSG